ncbi:MAG: Manganese ABC transporter substrate-binding lipoprotein [Chroococcidiopsis sp. SAG 2025]|uniref:metal ABC transporter solute-binding protein, Zn/Mn family n=1 Tax=Chroococcidiopsis sp. SAG 2025 TaxID=171389 RepID=UPI00293736C2|nr:zinc ABC transporter substrate-binding protein [Chroococcidiopsis sp. SAG 2025]MDV2991204.1 Manganese ABC transporter substrate-binding lipoprotein [Chroococcidiopsis sp. SAG 2025]
MLKLSVKSIATFAMALGLAGLNLKGDEAIAQKNNLPLVVVTNSVTCGLTQEIAANTIDLKCLIEPGADPHLYQPKPEDSKAIEQAQLILYGGYNFESGLIKLIEATSNPAPKVAVHEIGVPKPQQLEEDGQTVTDPHVWHNAQNGVRIANAIADSLSKAFPNNAAKYTSNTKQLTGELKQIHTWIKSQIQTIPPGQRKLVTTHDAMGYYANAYGIPIEGALQGISTEERPTAARVAELVKDIRKSGVPTIFAEKTVNPQLIEAVAREANVKVAERKLYADSLGEPGTDGDTYPKMLVANTRTIVEGLEGNYAAFESKSVP